MVYSVTITLTVYPAGAPTPFPTLATETDPASEPEHAISPLPLNLLLPPILLLPLNLLLPPILLLPLNLLLPPILPLPLPLPLFRAVAIDHGQNKPDLDLDLSDSSVQGTTGQFSAVRCSTVQCSAVQCHTVTYCAVQRSVIQ